MKRAWIIGSIAASLFVITVVGLAIFGVHQQANTKVQVVAAENVWGDIIRQIGGDKVTVTSIISNPNDDPHLYESNARDALALSKANIVVSNGLGYDDFMTKLLRANPNSSRTVLTVADSLQVRGPTANPHLWYDLPRIPAVAQVFEQALARADPADAALFTHNLQQFDTALQPSLTTLGQIKTQFAGSPVAYTERVPGYVLADAGLNVQTPAGFARSIEEGNEPSASDQSNMQALIVHKRIRALLYNAQATSPATEHIRTLAAQTGIPVVPVTETIPRQYHSFQEWQQAQLDELLHALQQ